MALDLAWLTSAIELQLQAQPFSGVVSVSRKTETLFAQAYGFANRAEAILNRVNTRFGTASGSKTFTGVAVCQLVDQGLIAFDTRLKDCLDIEFPHFAPDITVHHLLTHTSGIPDYFDEEIMPDEAFELLWHTRPMYTIRTPRDLLPMFQDGPMKFAPGTRFAYSNAGFVVLGLIIEQQTGMSFTDYVGQRVFAPAGMTDSGYFALDRLPGRTAYGYLEEDGGVWRTNLYTIPIGGQPDGGAFVTAPDMAKFWDALTGYKLLSPTVTRQMLHRHTVVEAGKDDRYYGYGVWIRMQVDRISHYYALGSDPGVAFVSALFPEDDVIMTILGNVEDPVWSLYGRLIDEMAAQLK
ncbi:MAG: serine hydrolase [Anaerolineae bacterium]|nr:serine hydrolase [Anaerolineae bacterium]